MTSGCQKQMKGAWGFYQMGQKKCFFFHAEQYPPQPSTKTQADDPSKTLFACFSRKGDNLVYD